MGRMSPARFALLLILSTAFLLVLSLWHGLSIATFSPAELLNYNLIASPVDERTCQTIPEESDPHEVRERNKSYFEYLETAERFSSQRKTKKLPDLIGIGTEKCGTDAVRQIISRNPLVVASTPSELHFFTDHPSAGVRTYLNMMPEVKEYQKVMEKTPRYLWGRSNLPQRMLDCVPDAKLFLVLCDPVARTVSDFEQEKYMRRLKNTSRYDFVMDKAIREMKGFLETSNLNDDDQSEFILDVNTRSIFSHILAGGLYYFHLLRWFRVYNRSQILIIDFDDVMYRPWEVAKEMQDFLEVPRLVIREDFAKNPETEFFQISKPKVVDVDGTKTIIRGKSKCHKTKDKSRTRNGAWDQKPKESTLDMVRHFYSEYNEKLFELIGRRFSWQ